MFPDAGSANQWPFIGATFSQTPIYFPISQTQLHLQSILTFFMVWWNKAVAPPSCAMFVSNHTSANKINSSPTQCSTYQCMCLILTLLGPAYLNVSKDPPPPTKYLKVGWGRVPIHFGNDLSWIDLPHSKGFIKFGCLEPSKSNVWLLKCFVGREPFDLVCKGELWIMKFR